VLRAAQRTAVAARWTALGADDRHIWGIYTNRKSRFEVTVSRDTQQLTCSCPAEKRPCPHLLGLLLHFKAQPSAFTAAPPPAWAQTAHPTAATERRPVSSDEQMERLFAGLTEFERWLEDMLRTGLAALPERPRRYWTQMVDRLVDAHLPRLAYELGKLAAVPRRQGRWSDYLLREIGRFYLIIQSGKQYTQLPPADQFDFRAAVGWFPQTAPAKAEPVEDDWLVLGQVNTPLDRSQWQRSWLWGVEHGRMALISTLISHNADVRSSARPVLIGGTRVRGTLHFLPGQVPLNALPGELGRSRQNKQGPLGRTSLAAAIDAYTAALSRNPFCRPYPLLLQEMLPARSGERWYIGDGQGRQLPLPADFRGGWHLLSLCQPKLALLGEWDGRQLTPLTAWAGDRWLDLRIIRGLQ